MPAPATLARLGVLRLGAGRLGYAAEPTRAVIRIAGVTPRLRIAGLGVRNLLNDSPDTCTFVTETPPAIGADVQIGLGGLSFLLFGGTVESYDQTYAIDTPELPEWHVTCQDKTVALTTVLVRKRYGQQSATPIVLDLMATYAPEFTTVHVAPDLPTVEGGIDFTEEYVAACLTRVMARVGGYWYPDYTDIHAFLTETSAAPDDLVADSPTLLWDPKPRYREDRSQLRTRVRVEGGGSTARRAVAVGDTVLPVSDAWWYDPAGGIVVAGPQRIAYAGIGREGGPAAPTATGDPSPGGNLVGGPYTYRTALVTDVGEGPLSEPSDPVTLPGIAPPVDGTTAVDGFFPVPAGALTIVNEGGGNVNAGDHGYYLTFWIAGGGETTPSPVTPVTCAGNSYLSLHNLDLCPPGTLGRNLYRTTAAEGLGGPKRRVVSMGATGTTYEDNRTDAAIIADGFLAPTVNTAAATGAIRSGQYGQWAVGWLTDTGITRPAIVTPPVQIFSGAAGLSLLPMSADARVIGRVLYRVVSDFGPHGNATVVLYEATIPDTVTTYFLSTMADADLGEEWDGGPEGDDGQIDVSDIATGGDDVTSRNLYRARGGAAYKLVATIDGNLVTDFHDNVADGSLGSLASALVFEQLTGIPASGPGSILCPILVGDDVNIHIVCDDLEAQAEFGVVEYPIRDGRLSIAGATAVGNADLALFARPIGTWTYACLDPNTRTGKSIHINLPDLGPVGDYTIQSVAIDQIDVAEGIYPRYTVDASTVRFSVEDVLRRLEMKTA